ncbi:MAG: DUF1949 domain-containing protein, partial [Clostridia bacterium]|nr:DUF1949 domain-containing protein [Clostridia bacterium]
AAIRFFTETGASVINCDYANDVIFTVAVKKSEEEGFNKSLLNRLCGKVKIQKLKEYFYPFKI